MPSTLIHLADTSAATGFCRIVTKSAGLLRNSPLPSSGLPLSAGLLVRPLTAGWSCQTSAGHQCRAISLHLSSPCLLALLTASIAYLTPLTASDPSPLCRVCNLASYFTEKLKASYEIPPPLLTCWPTLSSVSASPTMLPLQMSEALSLHAFTGFTSSSFPFFS